MNSDDERNVKEALDALLIKLGQDDKRLDPIRKELDNFNTKRS